MTNLWMIVMVAIVAIAVSAMIAFAFYLIDRNADRHDKRG